MHRILIGILILSVLYFAADRARLQDRNRFLEERLAARTERPQRPAPLRETGEAPVPDRPMAAPAAAPSNPDPGPAAPSATVTPVDLAPLVRAQEAITGTLGAIQTAAKDVQAVFQLIEPKDPLTGLDLQPWQKGAVDAAQAARDAKVAAYEKAIQLACEEAEQAIERQLTPEQRAKYDLAKNASREVQIVQDPVADPASAGPPPGFLGIQGANAAGGGVAFTDIIAGTAASSAGLLAGDVLLEFNDQKVADYASLVPLIRAQPQGSPVNLKIRRNGAEFTQAVLLGARR